MNQAAYVSYFSRFAMIVIYVELVFSWWLPAPGAHSTLFSQQTLVIV